MFCNDQKSGSITIQSVNGPIDDGFALGLIVPGYGVCQSVFKMALGRMDRDARSLIYDQDILIFIDNGKGERGRDDALRTFFLYERNAKTFVFL